MPHASSGPEPRIPEPRVPETIAAVDLGSNSFHMVVARLVDGHLQVLDRIKETVRLAGGLGADNTLDPAAQQRAVETLTRFGERVRGFEADAVRAVGTNTLRKARNARQFLARLEAALGHPIEIVSGLEEARLVYLGVAWDLDATPEQRLVVDIGGGSTEFIIGSGFEPKLRESKYMGCVSFSQRFFGDGHIGAHTMREAILAAGQELQSMAGTYRKVGWDVCVGTSGTARAVLQILEANGWSRHAITADGLERLKQRLIDDGRADPSGLAGLAPDRAPVLAGGLAILIAAFENLRLERMGTSDGALREGLLYEQVRRIMREDIRELTVGAMASRYSVDLEHAGHVERTALELLDQVKGAWGLDDPYFENMLRWAARLHEIGLAITHSNHHKHGSYLLENSDMPGFSRQDQQMLWALVRTHRRSFKPHRFDNQPRGFARAGRRLAMLLRTAVLLHRSRMGDVPAIGARAGGRTLELQFPDGWLETMPLTHAALDEEAALLASADYRLVF